MSSGLGFTLVDSGSTGARAGPHYFTLTTLLHTELAPCRLIIPDDLVLDCHVEKDLRNALFSQRRQKKTATDRDAYVYKAKVNVETSRESILLYRQLDKQFSNSPALELKPKSSHSPALKVSPAFH